MITVYGISVKKARRSEPDAVLLFRLLPRAWQSTLDSLPGYSGELAQSGQVLSLRAALPWWRYRQAKAP